MNVDFNVIRDLGLNGESVSKTKSDELGQEEFLKLMTTQLTNQNPLKPMENGEFLGQIAQFGTVSGIKDLQDSFSEFSASISSDQALLAASLIGRQVLAPGNEALLAAGGEVKGQLDLPAGSTGVRVQIIDSSSGEVVRNLDLGAQPSGSVAYIWDGLEEDGSFADPGIYRIQAEASIGGETVGLAAQINSTVESVTMGNGQHGLLINLAGLGAINFNDIQQIL